MCDDQRRSAANDPITISDIITLVAEDRAEIEFRHVGTVAKAVSEQCFALGAFRLQLQLIERNSDDPVIRVAAERALDKPSADTVRVLLQVTGRTPWHPLVQHVLAELAIAHADTVFAGESDDR